MSVKIHSTVDVLIADPLFIQWIDNTHPVWYHGIRFKVEVDHVI